MATLSSLVWGLFLQSNWLIWRESYSHVSRELHIVVLGAGKYTISPRASEAHPAWRRTYVNIPLIPIL